jgi:hypothetical protein
MLIQKRFRYNNRDEKLLTTEYELLKRIFLKLFPNILKGIFTNPIIAWRKFSVTITVLSSVAIGYLSYLFRDSPNKGYSLEKQAQI